VRLGNGYIALAGTAESLADQVGELRRAAERDRRDPDELTVAMVSRLTVGERPPPGDASLRGSPQQIVEALGRFREAGLQHLIADVRAESGTTLAATLAALETVARDVLPAVKEAVAS
jgi:alkanesulfonate monooxygenase SsuD/methylene tetrahydromethanopterin reductase-like flavin-dependent oxidoreductase (luciferase family)